MDKDSLSLPLFVTRRSFVKGMAILSSSTDHRLVILSQPIFDGPRDRGKLYIQPLNKFMWGKMQMPSVGYIFFVRPSSVSSAPYFS